MQNAKYNSYQTIYKMVQKIPEGKVATYGQIAKLVDRCTARMVGYALHALPDDLNVPWQRVVNARGMISPRSYGASHYLQAELLRSEGVAINSAGKIDLALFRWQEYDVD